MSHIVDQLGTDGVFYYPADGMLDAHWNPYGANDRGGACHFEGSPTLKAALARIPALKAEHPEYTTWLIEAYEPVWKITVPWRDEQAPPGVVKVAMMDRSDD